MVPMWNKLTNKIKLSNPVLYYKRLSLNTSALKDNFQKYPILILIRFPKNVSDTFFQYIFKLYLDTFSI